MRIKNDSIAFVPQTFTTAGSSTNDLGAYSTTLYVTPSTNLDIITGIKGLNTDGYVLFIKNVHTSNILVLSYNNVSSASGNRFLNATGDDVYVAPGKYAMAIYGNNGFSVYELKENVFIEVGKTGIQSINDNVLTLVNWDLEVKKRGLIHDNVTNNTRVTIPVAGDYRGICSINWTTWSGGFNNRFQILVLKNGVSVRELFDFQLASSNTPTLTSSFTLINATATDYIEIQVLQNNGNARLISNFCFFYLEKIS